MGEVTMYSCDECGKTSPSDWAGPPHGWVSLCAQAKWDGHNYHIQGDAIQRTFCSLRCFRNYLEKGGGTQ